MKLRQLYLKHQKLRRDVKAFESASIDKDPFDMPSNLELFVRAPGGTVTEEVAVTVNGKDIYCPPLEAGQIRSIGWIEIDKEVDVEPPFTLMYFDGIKYIEINSEPAPPQTYRLLDEIGNFIVDEVNNHIVWSA